MELIPDFIKKWEDGFDVVIGLRKKSNREGWIKKTGTYFFYKILYTISDVSLVPNETDYRLLDREVIDTFNKLTEKNRITRGLINWLG